jgi:quercetin dioxygenase-like cupin family protein
MESLFFPDAAMVRDVLEEGKVSRKLRARGGGLMMVEVFFETGGVGAEHRHPHQQVTYCLAGEFRFSIDGQASTLKAGDSVYIPASAMHGVLCLAAGSLLDVFTPQREDFLK